jgi:hypothetical protein
MLNPLLCFCSDVDAMVALLNVCDRLLASEDMRQDDIERLLCVIDRTTFAKPSSTSASTIWPVICSR